MLLSISGLIGSGKDTVADYLVNYMGFERESFASNLKDACSAIFGWDREMLEGRTKEARAERERVDEWWSNRLGIANLTPRWVLQNFGTEVCRNHFHIDVWLASLEYDLLKKRNSNIIITDARFRNELDMVKRLGGYCLYVERGNRPEWFDYAARYNGSSEEQKLNLQIIADIDEQANIFNRRIHESEWRWIGFPFDTNIDNNSTLEDLYKRC